MSDKIKFDNNFHEFIVETKDISKISEIIYLYISYGNILLKDVGDYFKCECDENINDMISYIPISKKSSTDLGFDDRKYRTKIKIGRLPYRIFNEKTFNDFLISNSDIEHFVNLYKSYFSSNEENLFVVEGENIKNFYLEDNYNNENINGTLWKSCMRYHDKNEYMNLYSSNIDSVKMLVLLDNNQKVKGRALLWQSCSDINNVQYKVMDRIYSIYEHDVNLFKKWAIKNGYIHKYEQSSKSENKFLINGKIKKINLTIKIKNHKFKNYPYMDSFKWYSKDGFLSNSDYFNYNYILENGDGLLEEISDEYDDNYIIDSDWTDW